MKLSKSQIEQLQEDLSNVKTIDDLMGENGAIKKLFKNTVEQIFEVEMDEHLGYQKHSPTGNNTGNSRNGYSSKGLISSQGEIDIFIPRDRDSSFEPIVIPKYKRIIGDLEDIILSMYAKGVTVRDIQNHIEDIYGFQISATSISNITDKIINLAREWQCRPLNELYTIVFLDAIHFKVKEEGKYINKAGYSCLGIDLQGYKDLLGIWIGEAESAKFWMNILNELRNRGVKDILICCVDGLSGFKEAISAVFPETMIQKCVIHQIRNSLKYLASKDKKEFIKELKLVYNSPTEENALYELDRLELKWEKKYPIVINSWRVNWPELSTFFQFPQEIRTIIYTTNAVEGLHRQFRKVTKSKSLFPNDEALTKMLFLAYKDISKKWRLPLKNWAFVISQFSIIFDKRLKPFI